MTTPSTDDPTELPWARTQTIPYAARPASEPAEPSSAAAEAAPTPDTAPALKPPTWTGRKTAIAAALAIGISSMGAVAAAAAVPPGTQLAGGQSQQGGFGPGGGQRPGFGRQGQGGPGVFPQGPGGPGTTQQLPGSQLQQSPANPNASTP